MVNDEQWLMDRFDSLNGGGTMQLDDRTRKNNKKSFKCLWEKTDSLTTPTKNSLHMQATAYFTDLSVILTQNAYR